MQGPPNISLQGSDWNQLSRTAYRAARKVGLGPDDSWDIASIAIACLLSRVRDLHSHPDNCSGWIYEVARRRAIDLLRSSEWRASRNQFPVGEYIPSESYEEELVGRLNCLTLAETIFEIAGEILTHRQLEAVHDYYMYEGNQRSIHGIFRELSQEIDSDTKRAGTRRTHFLRAAKKLRSRLSDDGIDLDCDGGQP